MIVVTPSSLRWWSSLIRSSLWNDRLSMFRRLCFVKYSLYGSSAFIDFGTGRLSFGKMLLNRTDAS